MRQFYQGGKVPQTRLLSPITGGISSGGGGNGNAVVTTAVISGGSNPPPAPVVAKQAVITTTVLGPGQQFVFTLTDISRSFQLLNVASDTAARVQLYGTSGAQFADLRAPGLDQAPPAGTSQGLITDVALDSSPFVWNYQNRIGSNSEVPQKQEVFVTITNLSGAAVPITVTMQYIPIEA